MPSIYPHVFKNRIPRGLQFPVRYADLESCIIGPNTQDIYLDVNFRDRQEYWKADRERRIAEGHYRLLEISYLSERQVLGAPSFCPWSGQQDAIVVSAWVYPVPRSIGAEFAGLRQQTRGRLQSTLRRLMPRGIPCDPWRLTMELSQHSAEIVVRTQAWRGIKDFPEANKSFPIERTPNPLPTEVPRE